MAYYNPNGNVRLNPQAAAEKAVSVIGFGYDLTSDIRLSACKPGPSQSGLIELDRTRKKDLSVPGNVVVSGVSASIKCDKGERIRFSSDALPFNQMSEHFNRELSLSGKIPSGIFNSMFGFKGWWQNDASTTKILAFDGWLISLYTVELERSQITLSDRVKQEVPTMWDPVALAEFIDKYGTHVIVGVKMGGKDVIHMKQLLNSNLHPTEVQKLLKQLADERFSEDDEERNPIANNSNLSSGKTKGEKSMRWDLQLPLANAMRTPIVSHSKSDDLLSIHIRRGGLDSGQSHKQWLSSVSQYPNVISMSFVPIASLLSGIQGSGFLSHAMNLYMRYKPPLEELAQFLEYQLPRQWAPAYNDLPLGHCRRKKASPSLQFTPLGPKLYVNTIKVDTDNRPVTGVRLYLEGKRSDHLAIHLQYLSTLPHHLRLSPDRSHDPSDESVDRGYFEPVKWSIFSHVCTAPVEHPAPRMDDPASIATSAWFEVKGVGIKKVLFLRLGFSAAACGVIRRSEWDGPATSSKKSGLMSMLMSTPFSTALTNSNNKNNINNNDNEKAVKVDLNSAVYPGGPPSPAKAAKMSQFVDTKEVVRGPEDPPGYWVVTGAKLCVEGGMIRIKVKYSLLTILDDEDEESSFR